MKAGLPRFTIAALGFCLSFAGCGDKSAAPTTSETVPSATPAPAAPAAPAPAAPVVAANPTPAATPAATPARLAPAGVYYLTAKISITTDDGIFGLPAGSKVSLVTPGQYRDAENHLVSLRDDQVTNDLQVAAQLSRGDAASQAAIRQEAAQRQAALVAKQQATAKTNPPALATQAAPAPAVVTPALRPAGDLGMGVHDRDIDKGYRDELGFHWKDVQGRWHIRH